MLRENVEVMLVDIGDACLGHAVFDVGSVMVSCLERGNFEVSYEEKTRMLGLNPTDSAALWPIICGVYFDLDDPVEVQRCSDDLMVYGRLVECYQNTRLFEGNADAMIEKMLPDIRENLLPLVLQLKR